jgi:hypothetical protein
VPTTSRVISKERLPDGVRWVGEAQNAYPGQLELWRRTLELHDWLSLRVTDEIRTSKPDAKIDWLLHTLGRWEGSGRRFTVTFEGVRVDLEFTSAPMDLAVTIEQTPVGQDGKRTTFLRASTHAVEGKSALDVRLRAALV